MYGSEIWRLTKKVKKILKGCDRRMIRYMTGIKLKEAISSQEILIKCGLKDLSSKIRRRLQWFGHVKSDMADGGCFGSVQEMYIAHTRKKATGQIEKIIEESCR